MKLTEIAMEKGYNLITLPEAFSPRAMLTYSVVQQLFMFHHYCDPCICLWLHLFSLLPSINKLVIQVIDYLMIG